MHVRIGDCFWTSLRPPAARGGVAGKSLRDQGDRKRLRHRKRPRPPRSFLPHPPGTAPARRPRSSATRHAPRRGTWRALNYSGAGFSLWNLVISPSKRATAKFHRLKPAPPAALASTLLTYFL